MLTSVVLSGIALTSVLTSVVLSRIVLTSTSRITEYLRVNPNPLLEEVAGVNDRIYLDLIPTLVCGSGRKSDPGATVLPGA